MRMRAFTLCTLLSACAAAQDAPPQPTSNPSAPQDEAAKRELLTQLAAGGVRVDVAAQTIAIDAVINAPPDPIEYLLIHQRGKVHEALFVTEVKPSLLNAAFYALGCANGVNARAQPIEPPPSEAEIENGAEVMKIIPPQGTELWITARWQDADGGGEREQPIEALLIDLTTGKPVEENAWIFLGGREAPLYRNEPPVFVADFEGNLISVCYLGPENHLITIRHERAPDDENWWISEACPPAGTKVELRFHRQKPALAAAVPVPVGVDGKGKGEGEGAGDAEAKKKSESETGETKKDEKTGEGKR